MRFRALALAVILGAAATVHVYSIGLGAQANINTGRVFAPGAALLISPSEIIHIAVNWHLGENKTSSVGLTLDVVPLMLPVFTFAARSSYNVTLGVGLFSNVILNEHIGVDLGLRIPIGMNVLLAGKMLEVFLHVAPSFGVVFRPSFDMTDPFFPLALGIRVWLGR